VISRDSPPLSYQNLRKFERLRWKIGKVKAVARRRRPWPRTRKLARSEHIEGQRHARKTYEQMTSVFFAAVTLAQKR
jgi:hypothetical protein